jgi:hypothetical protein
MQKQRQGESLSSLIRDHTQSASEPALQLDYLSSICLDIVATSCERGRDNTEGIRQEGN